MSLWKQVDNETPDNIGDDNTTLLTIRIPMNTTGLSNIIVYRYHEIVAGDNNVDVLSTTPNANSEKIEIGSDFVTICAMKFSEYAIAYKEQSEYHGGGDSSYVPYDIDTYITEIDTAVIDADYMNANFKKYLSIRESGRKEDVDAILNEIHRSFASLPQDKQKTAHGIMLEIQSGKLKIEEGKTLNDYITERMTRTKNDIIRAFAESFGLNENLLRELIEQKVTETTINSFGRFDNLLKTVDKQKAKEFIENAENRTIPAHRLSMKISAYVQKFILNGGVDVIYSAAAEEKLLPDSITAADLSLFYRGAPNLTAAADEEKKYEK